MMEKMRNDESKKAGKKGITMGPMNSMKSMPKPVGTGAQPGKHICKIKTIKGNYADRTGYGTEGV